MHAFWRQQPLDHRENELLQATFVALQKGTFKQCPSTVGVATSAFGSGDYLQALASGLLCTGGIHFPILETYDLLTSPSPAKWANNMLASGKRVPGWGSAFVKGSADPDWDRVDMMLRQLNPGLFTKMESIRVELHRADKIIYPNATCYTVASAIAVGMPRALAPYLVLKGKLDAWSAIFLENLKGL